MDRTALDEGNTLSVVKAAEVRNTRVETSNTNGRRYLFANYGAGMKLAVCLRGKKRVK